MKILLVIDQFYDANNGMTISARRFARVLAARGHEVRVVSTGDITKVENESEAYMVEKARIPLFDGIVSAQGMTFAKPNEEVLRRAVEWADLVHFLVPFALSKKGIQIARALKVPYTAAFHVQPENITASAMLGKAKPINDLIYRWFNLYIYRYCTHIHCPSAFIANQLRKAGYAAHLHVISNGIDPDFVGYRKLPKTPELEGKFVILMVGRLSREKRQDVFIRAVAKSKYADNIQLILAGKGPRRKAMEKKAAKLPVPGMIRFYTKQELLDVIAMSDLYVHASDAEIEAMSCMEAFAGGLVPVIANSKMSATPQFALDARSLFRAGDARDLAGKIDYWIEHEEERKQMEHAYAALGEEYNLEACVLQAEEMFRQAIREGQKD